MKAGLFACAFLLASPAWGLSFRVLDVCGGKDWLNIEREVAAPQSLGAFSIEQFERAELAFEGNSRGVHHIRKTPVGDAALEILSDTEMRAYGWCFALNGKIPDKLSDQVMLNPDDDSIVWFFAYAHYRDGEWVEYCVSTHIEKPAFLCPFFGGEETPE